MGYVGLAVFTHVSPICINDCSGVVEHSCLLFLKNRNHHNHLILLRILLHPLDSGTGNGLSRDIPFCILTGTEIGGGKYFLETKDLNTLLSSFLNKGNMFLNNCLFDFFNRSISL